MHKYQMRLIEERLVLDDKIAKLETFVKSNPEFSSLDPHETERLTRQLSCMKELASILTERILACYIISEIY
jgi:hypothetical protein